MRSRFLNAIKLRIDQEAILLRYAYFVNANLGTRLLLGSRLVFLLLAITCAVVSIGTLVNGNFWSPFLSPWAYLIFHVAYLLNYLFEKGFSKKTLQKWRKGVVVMVFLQFTIIQGLSVSQAVTVVGDPLNFPNPCRLGAEGTTIGYFLSEPADVEIRLYTQYGDEIYTVSLPAGQDGGLGGTDTDDYNRVVIDGDKIGTSNLPAGVYFYLIMHEGDVLARGRIAALP